MRGSRGADTRTQQRNPKILMLGATARCGAPWQFTRSPQRAHTRHGIQVYRLSLRRSYYVCTSLMSRSKRRCLYSATFYCNVIHFELNGRTAGGKMSPVLFQGRKGSAGINPGGSHKGFNWVSCIGDLRIIVALESGNKDSPQISAIDSRLQFMFGQSCLFNKVPFISRHQALCREFFTAAVM